MVQENRSRIVKKCPMCRDTIRFKPDQKDLMMNRIRCNVLNEYGDNICMKWKQKTTKITSRTSDNQQRVFPLFGDEELDSDYDDEDYDDSDFMTIY